MLGIYAFVRPCYRGVYDRVRQKFLQGCSTSRAPRGTILQDNQIADGANFSVMIVSAAAYRNPSDNARCNIYTVLLRN